MTQYEVDGVRYQFRCDECGGLIEFREQIGHPGCHKLVCTDCGKVFGVSLDRGTIDLGLAP